MIKKYDLELIKKYVNGDDIDNFNVEDLEDNIDFMKNVINYTNDKKMYNMCSEKVKLNYDFVNFLYKKFYDDKKFVYNVLLYYINKLRNDNPEYIDIILKLCDISKSVNEDTFCKCCAMLESVYFDFRIGSENIKNNPKDEKDIQIVNDSGMGFSILLEAYMEYENVINHFASLYIDDIFSDSGLDLEKIVHQAFTKKEDLEKYGLNRFIIDIIRNYDNELANYVSIHKELLEDVIKHPLSRIIKNWNWFVKNNEKIRYEIIFEQTYKIMEEYQDYCSFGTDVILYYVARKLGIEENLLKYDRLTEDEYKDIEKLIEFEIKENDFKLVEMVVFNKIKKMILNILSQRVVEEIEEEYFDDDRNSHEVIKVDFKNRTKNRC